jgi:malate dehydrogenase
MISVVGTGRLGSAICVEIARRELGDLTMVDIIPDLPQGEALDIGHMASEMGVDGEIRGSNDYKDIAGSDIVVLVAGLPRKPGMTRLDLQDKNEQIVHDVAKKVAEYTPRSRILVVTNPMDVMTYVTWKASGFNQKHVFGMGGMLDISRFKYFLSIATGTSRKSIDALVIGEHGETMMPLPRFSTINGVSVTELLSKEKALEAVDRTRKVAAEVIAKKGATVYAPASCVATMVESVVKDRHALLPASAYLNGEYGVKGIYIGVPIVLGADGVERIIELPLNDEEMAAFKKSAETLQAAVSNLKIK